jgi:nitrate/nitrite transporter NarK
MGFKCERHMKLFWCDHFFPRKQALTPVGFTVLLLLLLFLFINFFVSIPLYILELQKVLKIKIENLCKHTNQLKIRLLYNVIFVAFSSFRQKADRNIAN